jgi:hypothetical protein
MSPDRVRIPLRLGPLAGDGWDVQRSGVRWLCDDGHLCRPGEVVAWCNIGLAARPGASVGPHPFGEELRDFQVALAPRLGGRLIQTEGASRGGFIDLHTWHHSWSADTLVGHLECPAAAVGADPEAVGRLRMLFLAGRRVAEMAEVRWGPLTGWHDRCRGWWSDGGDRFGTVLSLGICGMQGIIRGDQGCFQELFETVPGAAHMVFVPDDVLVPSAPVLLGQLRRTDVERQAISEDIAARLGPGIAAAAREGQAVTPDWIFAGCLTRALSRSPLLERANVLTPAGVRQVGPPDAVLLSLHSEDDQLLRHKRLGYTISCHFYRLQEVGAATLAWLKAEFEIVRRTPEEVRRDYQELIEALRVQTGAQVLILNAVSAGGVDDIYCYAPFDRPLGKTLPGIHIRELNLMLYDLARACDFSIVDVDALAAELGTDRHAPDGVHYSGSLQDGVRAQIVTVLRERGVPGFGAPPGPLT